MVNNTQVNAMATTGDAGPFTTSNNNVQPLLGLNYRVADSGDFPTSSGGNVGSNFLGEIVMFAGTPNIGLAAQGQEISIEQNSALFSLAGTFYGGDGQTTFALPDLRGRVAVGEGSGPGLTPRSLGSLTGSEQTTITYPEHNHTLAASGSITEEASVSINESNLQPELATNYIIALNGVFPSSSGGSGGGTEAFIGEVTQFVGNFAPNGWAIADGQLLSIAQNAALFAILGTTYGGDGQTTFALPDLRGRTVVGEGGGPGLSSRSLGETGGTETITGSPSHTHDISGDTTITTNASSVPYDNLQPFNTLNYIVALQGVFPSFNGPVPDEQFLGEVRLFAGNFAPSGWALADGQTLSITQNTALFALLGTTYGGDGRTTFALPDLRGRSPVGVGNGPGLTNRSLGQRGGTESENLLWPDHTHTVDLGPTPTPDDDDLTYDGDDNTIDALAGDDTIRARGGDDDVFGNDGDDRLIGNSGNDTLDGGADNDRLFGGSNNDSLIGGSGNDVLKGGLGNDTLIGVDENSMTPGEGERDILIGSSGRDLHVLGNEFTPFYLGNGNADRAVIKGFDLGVDQIQLFGIDSDYFFKETGNGHTNIFDDTGMTRDLVGVVRDVTGLDPSDTDTFNFVGGFD